MVPVRNYEEEGPYGAFKGVFKGIKKIQDYMKNKNLHIPPSPKKIKFINWILIKLLFFLFLLSFKIRKIDLPIKIKINLNQIIRIKQRIFFLERENYLYYI